MKTRDSIGGLHFNQFISSRLARLEKILENYLSTLSKTGPKDLRKAMEYSVLAGGKRLRSLLVYALGKFHGVRINQLDSIAASLELVHSFSLIHDDLPAMDDDDFRRGKPSLHKAFDESTAILAGDALLAMAFQILGEARTIDSTQRIMMINILAEALGPRGMVGGQYLDLHFPIPTEKSSKIFLYRIYLLKTGMLFGAALKMGAIVSNIGNGRQMRLFEQLGHLLGIWFQIKDDILNIIGDPKTLGKNVGTDMKKNKNTYPLLEGTDKAIQEQLSLQNKTQNLIRKLGLQKSLFSLLIDSIFVRIDC